MAWGRAWSALSSPGAASSDDGSQLVSDRHRAEATVHADEGPRHEARGALRCEPDHRPDQLVGLAQSARRRVPEDCFDATLVEQLAVLFGRKEAGHDGVHPDPMWRQLAGQVAG